MDTRDMSWKLFAALLPLALLAGCAGSGGPDFAVTPQYQPTRQLSGGAKNVAVAVKVIDSRTDKGRANAGGEVIAEGDKGSVSVTKPVPAIVEDAMSAALRAAGFQVVANAPVVIQVELVSLPVDANQFTHWGLPSERASTLDALGAIVPGPVRPTYAKAAMSVVIRKHDARLGFSHIASGEATNKSTNKTVVQQTLSEAISRAADDAVAKAAPDVEIVARTPVSAKEIFEREEEFAQQQRTIRDLHAMLAAREASLAGDKQAMEQMRQRLLEDQRKAKETAQADRQKLEKDRADMAKERDTLRAKLDEVSKKPQETPGVKEDLAKLQKQQQDLDARARLLQDTQAELDSRQASIAEREKNLASYSERLNQQAAANQALSAELSARQKDLDNREEAMKKWKQDLDSRADVKPPTQIIEKRHPLILITEPMATRTETTLGQVTVTGVAIDDRKIANLQASVNGQPVSDAPRVTGTGVGIRPTPGPVHTGQEPAEGAYALRRFHFTAPLRNGANEIVIEATNDDNLKSSEKLSVIHEKGTGRIHVITIGINNYQDREAVPPLQYAVADAKGVAAAFESLVRAPRQMQMLLDDQATRANLVQELFETLPTEVQPSDTVVIFFSGHGAPDTSTDAKGNVETFLLPIDANPTKLLATAIRMKDVGTILRRLPAERIVFLADTCYSGAARGAAGARTVAIPGVALKSGIGIRAVPDRPEGKGCAIITASTGIQVAQEKKELAHGIFTHFLIKGLQGAADSNHDGKVTVDELYEYVKTEVGKATNGTQTPQISRDPTAGNIVLSVVDKAAMR